VIDRRYLANADTHPAGYKLVQRGFSWGRTGGIASSGARQRLFRGHRWQGKESRYEAGRRFPGVMGKKGQSKLSGGTLSSGGTRGAKGLRCPDLAELLVGYWGKGKLFATPRQCRFPDSTSANLARTQGALGAALQRRTARCEQVRSQLSDHSGSKPDVVAEVSFHSWTEGRAAWRAPVSCTPLGPRDAVDYESGEPGFCTRASAARTRPSVPTTAAGPVDES